MLRTTSGGVNIKWNAAAVTYYINVSNGPSGSAAAIQNSLQTWTDVNTSPFVFVYGGSTQKTSTDYGRNDSQNIIVFGPMVSSGALAENTYWYAASSGNIFDSDIKFNTDYQWSSSGQTGSFDVQNVVTHELGHSLSLGDIYNSSDSEATMYGYASAGETKKRTLDLDDINGISFLYPSVVVLPNPPYSLR